MPLNNQQHQQPPANRSHRTGGPGILDGITSQFWDHNKGNVKWGGVIGSLIGAYLGAKMIGTGNWVGKAMAVFFAIGGAKGGNLISEFIGNMFNHHGGNNHAPGVGHGPSQMRAQEGPVLAQNQSINPDVQQMARTAVAPSHGVEVLPLDNKPHQHLPHNAKGDLAVQPAPHGRHG